MQTLKLTENKARQLYPSSSPEWKTVLEDSFGKDFFSQKITDRVKTFEDACKVVGISETIAIGNQGNDTKDEVAYKKLKIIVRALNEGWKPDWTNGQWDKYYPWFNLSSGSGLSYRGYAFQRSYSYVGSHLCFKSLELAEYASKQFIDIYTDFFIIN